MTYFHFIKYLRNKLKYFHSDRLNVQNLFSSTNRAVSKQSYADYKDFGKHNFALFCFKALETPLSSFPENFFNKQIKPLVSSYSFIFVYSPVRYTVTNVLSKLR